jgi:hypothetical protein
MKIIPIKTTHFYPSGLYNGIFVKKIRGIEACKHSRHVNIPMGAGYFCWFGVLSKIFSQQQDMSFS